MRTLVYILTVFIILFLILITHSCESPKKLDYKNQMQASVQKLELNDTVLTVEEAMKDKGLKGLSVAVFENYEIAWTKTWGVKDAESKDTMDVNTTFCTASVSKPVTATLFAILEEKGLIDLKAPVSTYLKRWQLPESDLIAGMEVTLEHLLSHTAGTSQHGHKDLYGGDNIPTVIESLNGEIPGGNRKIEFLDTPGTSWRYSGGGYVIAQIAVEDYLGKTLVELAEEHLFSPLNLKNTTFIQPNEPEFFLTNIAKSHDRNGQIIADGIQISPQLAPSGLWSNPTDMAVLMIEIQKALNGKGSRIISYEVAKRVTDIATLKVMGGWSLGWERRFAFGNHDWFSHGGSNGGMGGHIYATMQGGNGIAFFGNGGNASRIPILNSLRNSIIRSHGWHIPLNQNKFRAIPDSLGNQLKGNYSSVLFGEIVPIEYKEGQLFARNFGGSQKAKLFYLGNKTFKVDQSNRIIRFDEVNPVDNQIYTAILIQNGAQTDMNYALKKVGDKLPFEYLLEDDYEKALEAYQMEQKNNPLTQFISERTINAMGYQELGKKNFDLAISVFKINTILYPNSANAFDSLGEGYMVKGDDKKAMANYKKSLELNPDNENAKEMIDRILRKIN